MAKRFFVEEKDIHIDGRNINVIGNEVHHINVLRHKVGDIIKINNYIIHIENINNDRLIGKIEDVEKIKKENDINIILYQSYIKSDKMEFVVQKSVELGVNQITPFLSKNCVVKLNDNDKTKKLERLNKISVEASKQCNRPDIVEVGKILNISDEEFRKNLKENDYNILAYENSNVNLKDILRNKIVSRNNIKIGVIIGPEGGFDKCDIDLLKSVKNIYEISLGENILRAETASINLISIINYELRQ